MKSRREQSSAKSQSPKKSKVSRNNAIRIIEVQGVLRNKLSPNYIFDYRDLPTFSLFEKHLKHLTDLIERTVKYGESNSLLIIGPQGCGKTSMVRSITEKLREDSETESNLLLVELNGLLHTDDSIALRDISRQLKLGNVVDDKVFGSAAEHLRFMLEALRGGDQKSKSILFVLETFDLFCHHKNQTLLYNMFDVAQSSQAPIAVVGLTTRLDVIELLEKRVKSRFSHRLLHLFNAITFDQYCSTGQWFLSLPEKLGPFSLQWNEQIEELFRNKIVVDCLKRIFDLSKDFNALKQLLFMPVCSLSEEHATIEPSDFTDSLKLLATDSKSSMLNGLSVLELTLVVAIVNYTVPRREEDFNFHIIYNEYKKLMEKKSGIRDFQKAVVQKAFEHLETLELICATERGVSLYQKEYIPMKLLIEPIQIQESLQRYPNLPTDLQQLVSAILSSLYNG